MVKMFKRKYEAKLEFPAGGCGVGGGGGETQKKMWRGGMDIFQNHTICHTTGQFLDK